MVAEHQTQLMASLNGLEQSLGEKSEQAIRQQIAAMEKQSLEQLNANQQKALHDMNVVLNETKATIYTSTADEIKTLFAQQMTAQSAEVRDQFLTQVNADLPAVQEVLRENVEQLIAAAMPSFEQDLRKTLTAELKSLLQTVKFVLPD